MAFFNADRIPEKLESDSPAALLQHNSQKAEVMTVQALQNIGLRVSDQTSLKPSRFETNLQTSHTNIAFREQKPGRMRVRLGAFFSRRSLVHASVTRWEFFEPSSSVPKY